MNLVAVPKSLFPLTASTQTRTQTKRSAIKLEPEVCFAHNESQKPRSKNAKNIEPISIQLATVAQLANSQCWIPKP
jgi:hypothetical protein